MMSTRAIALGALATLLLAPAAFAGPKGTTMFAVQLSNGGADLYSQDGSHYITAYEHSELGAQAQMWHYMTDDYAMTISVGLGWFGETDKPGNNAPAGLADFKYTQSSYNVRVGGDRVVNVGERALFYFGPGIEYWSGKAKFDFGPGDPENWESENVSRYSVSGRVGGIMKISESLGFSCQVGRKLGLATATDKDRKTSWWPSSFDAAGGLVFGFAR